jgi:glutamate-1-semialdehyde 2,1-aminomutase
VDKRVTKSLELFKQAQKLLAGQTQLLSRHPTQHAFGVSPIYAERAEGCRFWDVDGHEYIDMAGGTGVIHLGYCNPVVDAAATAQIHKGIGYPINSSLEIELAELLVETIPCAEKVRYAKGGGDADAVAVRLARCYTGRDKVLFCGYHGWHDWYVSANLDQADSLDTHLRPGIPTGGTPLALAGTAIPFAYNDLEDLRKKLDVNIGQVACIIMEPARFQQPKPGFLEGVRQLANLNEVVLIFDEVVSGFRYARGGAQERFGVKPDMATFAKALGNGYPIAAIVGRAKVMDAVESSFVSSSYWSETASMAAAIAVQKIMRDEDVVGHVWRMGERYMEGLRKLGQDFNLPLYMEGLPPVFKFGLHLDSAGKYMTLMTQEMAKRGVHALGGVYIMYAHQPADIDQVLASLREVAAIWRKALDHNNPETFLEVPESSVVFKKRLV